MASLLLLLGSPVLCLARAFVELTNPFSDLLTSVSFCSNIHGILGYLSYEHGQTFHKIYKTLASTIYLFLSEIPPRQGNSSRILSFRSRQISLASVCSNMYQCDTLPCSLCHLNPSLMHIFFSKCSK